MVWNLFFCEGALQRRSNRNELYSNQWERLGPKPCPDADTKWGQNREKTSRKQGKWFFNQVKNSHALTNKFSPTYAVFVWRIGAFPICMASTSHVTTNEIEIIGSIWIPLVFPANLITMNIIMEESLWIIVVIWIVTSGNIRFESPTKTYVRVLKIGNKLVCW